MVKRLQANFLAALIRTVATDLEVCDLTEWSSLHDMLNTTLNNITLEYGEVLGDEQQFFTDRQLLGMETLQTRGDVILLRGNWEHGALEALMNLTPQTPTEKPPLFIVMDDGMEVETLGEEIMESFGWVRKENHRAGEVVADEVAAP